MRRERVGDPPLETAEEREARLRKTIEEGWKRPESETPKSEPVELHRFTLEEAEHNMERFVQLLERKTQGPEKGAPEEIANLERGIEWFQKTCGGEECGRREAARRCGGGGELIRRRQHVRSIPRSPKARPGAPGQSKPRCQAQPFAGGV